MVALLDEGRYPVGLTRKRMKPRGLSSACSLQFRSEASLGVRMTLIRVWAA